MMKKTTQKTKDIEKMNPADERLINSWLGDFMFFISICMAVCIYFISGLWRVI